MWKQCFRFEVFRRHSVVLYNFGTITVKIDYQQLLTSAKLHNLSRRVYIVCANR